MHAISLERGALVILCDPTHALRYAKHRRALVSDGPHASGRIHLEPQWCLFCAWCGRRLVASPTMCPSCSLAKPCRDYDWLRSASAEAFGFALGAALPEQHSSVAWAIALDRVAGEGAPADPLAFAQEVCDEAMAAPDD